MAQPAGSGNQRDWVRKLALRAGTRFRLRRKHACSTAQAPGIGGAACGLSAFSLAFGAPSRAAASDLLAQVAQGLVTLDPGTLVGLSLALGLLAFATTTAIVHVRFRRSANARELAAYGEISRLEAQIEEGRALLMAEPQIIVVWRDPAAEPEIIGNAPAFTGVAAPSRILAFGSWLTPASAHEIETAVDVLRARGAPLATSLITQDGRYIEADGRPVGSAVILRLRDITGVRRDFARLAETHASLEGQARALRNLLDALPAPAWIADPEGHLRWGNAAYLHAVEARDLKDAVGRDLALLDPTGRRQALQAVSAGQGFRARLPVVVAGKRRLLDVMEAPVEAGSGGIALDATEEENVRADLAHALTTHRRTLDQLSTAVAIFGEDKRLVFHNAAYAALFDLDPAFLDDRPTDLAVLDRLRAARRLPEQADFRAWRAELHEAYRSIEPREHWWHLPGGRTLRVVTAPNTEGGVTYLFDEVTERLALESRFNALSRIQSETLDALAEAVAVFGSDGRLGLSNDAFRRLWHLEASQLAGRPHIDSVVEACRPLSADETAWGRLRAAVTGIEARLPASFRMERADKVILDGSTQPLPDGGTLVTLRDVTDSVHVERALVERNDALVAADHLKSTFVSHVSYELRSPLTTIIGFAQLLDDTGIGPLNDRQRAYVNHITESSAALLAIINDILDLATIDAGSMTLDLAEVDVRGAMEGAAEGVRDRLVEGSLTLSIETPPGVGSFRADAKRVRQVLYNLLSNAVGFAPAGSTVRLAAERRGGEVVFEVRDQGPGIPPEIGARLFDRFETHTSGSRHRGVGLGLSIVRSLIALHGGSISVGPAPGGGTLVTCRFPLDSGDGRVAAE